MCPYATLRLCRRYLRSWPTSRHTVSNDPCASSIRDQFKTHKLVRILSYSASTACQLMNCCWCRQKCTSTSLCPNAPPFCFEPIAKLIFALKKSHSFWARTFDLSLEVAALTGFSFYFWLLCWTESTSSIYRLRAKKISRRTWYGPTHIHLPYSTIGRLILRMPLQSLKQRTPSKSKVSYMVLLIPQRKSCSTFWLS